MPENTPKQRLKPRQNQWWCKALKDSMGQTGSPRLQACEWSHGTRHPRWSPPLPTHQDDWPWESMRPGQDGLSTCANFLAECPPNTDSPLLCFVTVEKQCKHQRGWDNAGITDCVVWANSMSVMKHNRMKFPRTKKGSWLDREKIKLIFWCL